jgi:hypothetical protein
MRAEIMEPTVLRATTTARSLACRREANREYPVYLSEV